MAFKEKGKNRGKMDKLNYYHAILKKRLTKKRYEHSVAVAETSLELAKKHGCPKNSAYLAGLLHDYARELPLNKLAEQAKQWGLNEDEVMDAAPILWHGPMGALLVEKELGVIDSSILEAIRYHTTGAPNIDEIAKIVFLADLIEPGRRYPEVGIVRKEAFLDLDEGIFVAYELLIGYYIEKGSLIHPLTLNARNEFLLNKRR